MGEFVLGPKSGVKIGKTAAVAVHASNGLYTPWVKSINVERERDELDTTTLGVDHKSVVKGLRAGSGSMTIMADYDDASARSGFTSPAQSISNILDDIYEADEVAYLRWAQHDSTVDASGKNPFFDMEIQISKAPLGGETGQVAEHTIPFTVVKKPTKRNTGAFNQNW